MQDISLPSGAVARSTPHAQAAALRLGVLVLGAALAPQRRVLCAGVPILIADGIRIAQALLGALALLAVPSP